MRSFPISRAQNDRARQRVTLIGAASGLGGADARCAQAPAALASAGIAERLREQGLDAAWGPVLAPKGGGDARRRVNRLCAQLAAEVGTVLRAGDTACVIGGDHSCALGTWTGAARALAPWGPVGLVWVDAHLDSHTPRTSPSGRLHGMPLAALLGQGDDTLGDFGPGPLRPHHVCVVGARSFEPAEARLLERLGVRVFPMPEIRARGLGAVMADARLIAATGTAGFGLTLDLDALDPADAPAVATPVPGGLRAHMLLPALAELSRDPRFVALEIAEYCPPRDRAGRTARLVAELASAALGYSFPALQMP